MVRSSIAEGGKVKEVGYPIETYKFTTLLTDGRPRRAVPFAGTLAGKPDNNKFVLTYRSKHA